VRSAILLRAVVPEIERRAETLRQQIEGVVRSRERLKAQRTALTSEADMLERENRRLKVLLVRKKQLKAQTDIESKQVAAHAAKLAKEAKNLRDLMARLSDEQRAREKAQAETSMAVAPPKPELDSRETVTASLSDGMLSGVPISDRQGKLSFPVVGKIVSRYGQANENGVTERGIKLVTLPSAQVVAPYEGLVAFVGEFRGYGQLLIIEHSEGYHTLLAGMARIDSVMGQNVLTGEPVGVMDTSSGKKPVLYIEFRRKGRPVNPLPWLISDGYNAQG
jgi:septal ring factor EnvC (AmiA/AmiB activator)